MKKIFDMQFIRYINLFGRVTKISAKHCFSYNNMLVYVIQRNQIERAIGKDNINLKRLSKILDKRIRVVAEPNGIEDMQRFISVIISPIQIQGLEVKDKDNNKEVAISAGGRENKAMLIGRQRSREAELKDILEQYFGVKTLKII